MKNETFPKVLAAAEDTKTLLENMRDRLNIVATVEMDSSQTEIENAVSILFDGWLGIVVYMGEKKPDELSLTKSIIEELEYSVEAWKYYPGTHLDPPEWDQKEVGVFSGPKSAILKIFELYYASLINNTLQCIEEDEAQREQEEMYEKMERDSP